MLPDNNSSTQVTGAVSDVAESVKYDPALDEEDTSIKANVLARYFAFSSVACKTFLPSPLLIPRPLTVKRPLLLLSTRFRALEADTVSLTTVSRTEKHAAASRGNGDLICLLFFCSYHRRFYHRRFELQSGENHHGCFGKQHHHSRCRPLP